MSENENKMTKRHEDLSEPESNDMVPRRELRKVICQRQEARQQINGLTTTVSILAARVRELEIMLERRANAG